MANEFILTILIKPILRSSYPVVAYTVIIIAEIMG